MQAAEKTRFSKAARLLAAMLALVLPAGFYALSAFQELSAGDNAFPAETLVIESAAPHAFNVELASTPEQRARGMMFRDSLPEDRGMLFYSGTPEITRMWMKNTPLPLDMLFIAKDGTIRHIAARAVPYSEEVISSQEPVSAVLEIGGGVAEKLGIREGDTVKHRFFTP